MIRKPCAALMLAAALSGCASAPPPLPEARAYCAVAEQLRPLESSAAWLIESDPHFAEQVAEHNCSGAAICDWPVDCGSP